MQNDPLYQYIQLQIHRRRRPGMMPPFMPLELTRDPRNRHHDDRLPARHRLGRMLVRLGRRIEGHRGAATPAPDTASA